MEFPNKYKDLNAIVDNWLLELTWPEGTLYEAMSYSLLAGGKRFRPVLALASAEMLGFTPAEVRSWALAVEFVHTASLIHDDLPALDDDSLRRGKPSCHKRFGEGVAVLAGDALFSEAFRVLSEDAECPARLKLLALLARATTTLCDGQVLDLEASLTAENEAIQLPLFSNALEDRHLKKTAALISAAISGPAHFVDSTESEVLCGGLERFGEQFGLLFQITDDVLDATSSTERLGKDAHSDEEEGTPTYVSVYGVSGAQKLAERLAGEASSLLAAIPAETTFFESLIESVLARES